MSFAAPENPRRPMPEHGGRLFPMSPSTPSGKIVFLNRFYWPEEPATAQLLADLAEELAGRGWRVRVIASHSGAAGIPAQETRHGVEIRRVRGTRWAGSGVAGKAADFATFSLGALWALMLSVRRGDRVVALTDPPLLGIGAWVVARLRGARMFHWIQDIYPEIAVALTGHRWLIATRPWRNLAWRRADGCVTLGSDMASVLHEEGVREEKITVSANWAPAGLVTPGAAESGPLRAAWNLEGRFVVAYSGNLGRVHDLEPILEVAALLRNEPRVSFVFIGSGAQRDRLRALAEAKQLTNVGFHDAQPRRDLARTLALADLHLVTLLPGCERLVFPSKLYGIAAVGRPVIFVGPKESALARLVEREGFGRAFGRTETSQIAEAIRSLGAGELAAMAARADVFGRDHRGPARAADDWDRLLRR
ncbi:MAG: hypothetical protein JWM88_3294 [Verrucomicrobia bacterium]|nr:hypothetical protein [Verrucomicrobiota bacterium]